MTLGTLFSGVGSATTSAETCSLASGTANFSDAPSEDRTNRWSEFQTLKSSVAELVDCVEDLQSNMATAFSMLAKLSAKQSAGDVVDAAEATAQCQRLAVMAGAFCKPTVEKLATAVLEASVSATETSMLSKTASCQDSFFITHSVQDSYLKAAAPSSPRVALARTPMLPSTSFTPQKGPTRGFYSHTPRLDGTASTPSLPIRVAHSPGPPRTPCMPYTRSMTPGASPGVCHRSVSPMTRQVEPAFRIAPPPKESLPAPHIQQPSWEPMSCDGGKQQQQPPWDPRSNLRTVPSSGSLRGPSDPMEAIQQPSWVRSPSKDMLDATHPVVCLRSPAMSTRQVAELGPCRHPRKDLAEGVAGRSPAMSHRGIDFQSSPRDKDTMAPFMRTRGGMCTPMPASPDVVVATSA